MKKTDLEKNKGLKINGKMKLAGAPQHLVKDTVEIDRREQRKLDQALGLVPFAIKLNDDLVKQLQTLAQERQIGLNELTAELLKKGMASK